MDPLNNFTKATAFLLLTLISLTSKSFASPVESRGCNEKSLDKLIQKYNLELNRLQQEEAKVQWEINLGTNTTPNWEISVDLDQAKYKWNQEWCSSLAKRHLDKCAKIPTQLQRINFSTCGAWRFAPELKKKIAFLQMEIQSVYEETTAFGMKTEPDLVDFMATHRNFHLLEHVWSSWSQKLGTQLAPFYLKLVNYLNKDAQNQGFPNMASIWKLEMGFPHIEKVALELYDQIKPLYQLLHTYVRYKLSKFYGVEIKNTLPIHLLGNLYGQKWDNIVDIVLDQPPLDFRAGPAESLDSLESLWTSMGLPALPPSVRQNSIISQLDPEAVGSKHISCHGTAMNMFQERNNASEVSKMLEAPGEASTAKQQIQGDYRIVMCVSGKLKQEQYLTLAHELGHVYYYMASSAQPPMFQNGATAAFHEAVGDAVSYGYYNEKRRESSRTAAATFSTNDNDGEKPQMIIRNLMEIALAKIPQIPFGLIMDVWRWEIFSQVAPNGRDQEGQQERSEMNAKWWRLVAKYLGVSPPAGYQADYGGLDPLGKYHVVRNIPYIRYFFASFLQLQFFNGFCEGQQIRECQLEGNEAAGAKLWNMMKMGSSVEWPEALEYLAGSDRVSAKPLLEYFQPLQKWLEEEVEKLGLEVGWIED